MTLKKIVLILAISALGLGGSVALYSGCGSSTAVLNVNGWQPNVTGSLGSTVLCKFWQVGTPANNSGTQTQSTMATAYSTGFYVTTNWANGGVVGCPGAGPALVGTRTAFLYSIANGSSGQFLLMSTAWSSTLSRYDFDAITNGPGNTPAPVAIPKINAAVKTVVTGGAEYAVTWTALTQAQRLGYYDAAPTNNLVTGVALYYWNAAGVPSTYNVTNASWVLASGGPNARLGYVTFAGPAASTPDPGAATIFLPTAAPNPTYIALSLVFDGGTPAAPALGEGTPSFTQTLFAGQGVTVGSPTAAGVFASQGAAMKAGQVSVSWQSNVETDVLTYEVYYAGRKLGNYKPVASTTTAPKGNNSAYTVTFARPTQNAKFFVKVKAILSDGSEQWSSPVKVGANATVPELDD